MSTLDLAFGGCSCLLGGLPMGRGSGNLRELAIDIHTHTHILTIWTTGRFEQPSSVDRPKYLPISLC